MQVGKRSGFGSPQGRCNPAAGTLVVVVAICMLLASSVPVVRSFPYDPYRDSHLTEVAAWMDAGGGGADLHLRASPDGTRLLLMGFGAPGEVRVTDLDTADATILEPPEEDFDAIGCDWSMSGDQMVVWGEAGGDPRIHVYDTDTMVLNTTVPWLDLVDLVSVSEVTFLADDIIIAVAGRDENGASRLMFLEVESHTVRWNHVWEGNGTILAIDDTGGDIIILDDTETLTMLGGHDWNDFLRYPGALKGGPSAWSVIYNWPWIAADSEGRIVMTNAEPLGPLRNITVGEGPVLGVTWALLRYNDFVMATASPGGGSRLAAWQLYAEPPYSDEVREMCSMELASGVTMIAPDPRSNSTFYVATEDGVLHSIFYDIRPYPTEVGLRDPDQVDGRGLEPFLYWYPGGSTDNPRFYFNHRGSLMVLRGFGAAGDLRVVDRTFETVAQLSVPWPSSNFRGLEWSNGDRWLLLWGYATVGGDSKFVMRAFDAPTFEASKTFPMDQVLDKAFDINVMEFLPGDTVLAMTGLDLEAKPALMFVDLQTGALLASIPLSEAEEGQLMDLRLDGDDLVGYYGQGGVWVFGSQDRTVKREDLAPDMVIASWDVNATWGWTFVGPSNYRYNVTVWNGTPREEALHWHAWPYDPIGLVWANGGEGDMVMGSLRPPAGTSIQLWRRGGSEADGWRYLDGYTMVSELNTSRQLVQLEADPAYEGMVVASFLDGTIAMYYLNVTPYPPSPEELGDLDTGPIYPLDDGTGGSGGDLPWGSDIDWLFPLLLVVAIAGLVALVILVRYRERRSAD